MIRGPRWRDAALASHRSSWLRSRRVPFLFLAYRSRFRPPPRLTPPIVGLEPTRSGDAQFLRAITQGAPEAATAGPGLNVPLSSRPAARRSAHGTCLSPWLSWTLWALTGLCGRMLGVCGIFCSVVSGAIVSIDVFFVWCGMARFRPRRAPQRSDPQQRGIRGRRASEEVRDHRPRPAVACAFA
jgi:hypothetical protein